MGIEVRNLNKRFGATVVCDNLNLDIPDGELVALLGPSGSGKTTLLRIIAGLETADGGTIHYEDVDTTHRSPRDRNVGFVFQHYALFRHMTVFDNVAFPLRVRKWKRDAIEHRRDRPQPFHRIGEQGQESGAGKDQRGPARHVQGAHDLADQERGRRGDREAENEGG